MGKIPDFLVHSIENKSIEQLSPAQILASFNADHLLLGSSRDIWVARDPRSGEPVIYNPARAQRPHDYPETIAAEKSTCPICDGQTTGILDWAELEEGITFINKNLYPVLPPPDLESLDSISCPQGLHFVQWTSSVHEHDWHNLPTGDCFIVIQRLAALENALLDVSREIESTREREGDNFKDSWFVSIIKNVGSAVGGSQEHGHQQIVLGNIPPRRIITDQEFEAREGLPFSEYVINDTPRGLVVRDYEQAVLLVVEFMRRPYEMVLVLKDPGKNYLHQLDPDEIKDVARGWQDACRAIRKIMPDLNREVAFNIVTHNGPGIGLYFEILPYTQEQGGLEQLGLSICQSTPEGAAEHIRRILD